MRALFVVLVVVACAACRPRAGAAPEGAPPLSHIPVGPVPGLGEWVGPPNPLGGGPEVVQEGFRLFRQYNCYGCHGGRAGGGMGPSLRDADWLYGSSADHIFSSIADGRAHGMPSWSTRLTDQQVWQLTAYVQSLRTPSEPMAPK